jgi:TatD DNase family protein
MIDAHCHIDLYNNPEQILTACVKANMTVLAMTNLPSHFQIGYPHVFPYKNIRLALGMHPLHANEHAEEFPIFERNLEKTSYIGEIGLDFSREGYATRDIQVASFEKVLKLIAGQKKIVSLHSRRAEKEVLELLIHHKIPAAIFHWYSGSLSLINRIANAGYYFSVNPMMVNSMNGQKIIEKIPVGRILTETDGPFANINNRQIKPMDVLLVHLHLSRLWNKTPEEVEYIITDNFRKLLLHLK